MNRQYLERSKLHNSGIIPEYLLKQNTIISHNDGSRYFNTEIEMLGIKKPL
jgi:hypothetical protein